MTDPTRWDGRRIAALILGLAILGLLVLALVRRVGDGRVLGVLALGGVVGLVYAAMGRLPSSIFESSGGHKGLFSLNLRRDGDPRNLAPKLYLSILLPLLTLGALASVVVLSR